MNLSDQVEMKSRYYVLMGFAGAVGLAWNAAINSFINRYLPSSGDIFIAKFFYAIFLTLLLILLSEFLDNKKKFL